MLENNLIFSLVLSSIITGLYYLFSNKNNDKYNEMKNNLILLFGISFIVTFLLKICIAKDNKISSGENLLTHSSRPPF
tara:strand:- start:408 stop:641 length:234 start_codon:yes stop_codon:yes gene_type:complete